MSNNNKVPMTFKLCFNFFLLFYFIFEEDHDKMCFKIRSKTISCSRRLGLDKKKRALKFALKGSGSFKACFELYRCLNPEKSFKSSFKNDF